MDTYQKYIAYNAWANAQFAGLLATLPDTILDAPVKSSFDTLRKTVLHLLDAEMIWLERLHGRSVEGWPSEQMKPGQVFDALKKISKRLGGVEPQTKRNKLETTA